MSFFWSVHIGEHIWVTYFVHVVFIFQEFTNDIKNSSTAIKRMILLLSPDLEMMQIWSVNYTCQVCKLNMFFGHVPYYGQYLTFESIW